MRRARLLAVALGLTRGACWVTVVALGLIDDSLLAPLL